MERTWFFNFVLLICVNSVKMSSRNFFLTISTHKYTIIVVPLAWKTISLELDIIILANTCLKKEDKNLPKTRMSTISSLHR